MLRVKNWTLGTLRQWHWISSALSLVGMLGFAVTGITLNHAASIPATPVVTSIEGQLPDHLLNGMVQARLPTPDRQLRQWLLQQHGLYVGAGRSEWSEDELYLALPRPGGDAWLSVDLHSGEFLYEATDRGWVAYFNDLHKGRDSGAAWRWFIDGFALVCVLFALTGLLLLQRQTRHRPTTWPLVGLGLLAPVLLLIVSVH